MPPDLKARMERAFDQDFSEVRFHPGSHKPNTIGAKAFAIGDHIHFTSDQYKPGTAEGSELIAHELAHVVQQRKDPKVTPTLQGRAQSKVAVDKLVKLWKLRS